MGAAARHHGYVQFLTRTPDTKFLLFWRFLAQLRTFLQCARRDRFFALWVFEATTGIWRCELAGSLRDLLDLETGTLDIGPT